MSQNHSLPIHATRIVAHRGASHDAPENTLAAFNLAWQQDADAIEGDFYVTADRKIVCIHDDETSRLAGQKVIVEQSTVDQLRRLDVGKWKDPQFAGQKIPLLREVLETIPTGKAIVIELKSKKEIVPVLRDELASFDSSAISVLIITFDAQSAAQCKILMPQYRVHLLTEIDENSSAKQIAAMVRNVGADGVGMQRNPEVIDQDFVRELAEHGCGEFHVWTVDEVADAKYFRDLGAVGITTNVPAVIGAALRKEA